MSFAPFTTWQDWVVTVVQFWFTVALIPTLRHPTNKPTLSTSLQNGVLLFVLSATLATLHLTIGSIACAINAICWCILAYQRHKLDKRGGTPGPSAI